MEEEIEIGPNTDEIHKIWYKFSEWLSKTYGKDLYSDWIYLDPTNPDKKKSKLRYRNFDEFELSKRLVGYDVMERVEKYVKRYCPEIKIVSCDDALFASSIILLIPHPKMGITMLYIPQCTSIQNQLFLYKGHFNNLIKALGELENIAYGNSFESNIL